LRELVANFKYVLQINNEKTSFDLFHHNDKSVIIHFDLIRSSWQLFELLNLTDDLKQ